MQKLDPSNGMIYSSTTYASISSIILELLVLVVDLNAWQVMISLEYQEKGQKTLQMSTALSSMIRRRYHIVLLCLFQADMMIAP